MSYSALDLVEALVERADSPELVALELGLDGTLAEVAGLLEAVDPGTLDADLLVGYLRLTERVASMVAAVQQVTVAAVADSYQALGLDRAEAPARARGGAAALAGDRLGQGAGGAGAAGPVPGHPPALLTPGGSATCTPATCAGRPKDSTTRRPPRSRRRCCR